MQGARRMSMVERSVAVAGDHIGPPGNGLQNEGARGAHRILQTQAQTQVRSDGRRQGTARAVDVAAGNARRRQQQGIATARQQDIGHGLAGQVPAFEQHGRRSQFQQGLGLARELIGLGNGMPHQPGRLIQIRRDQTRPWEQLAHQHRHGLVRNEFVAAGGDHHRVKHHVGQAVVIHGPGHDLDHLGRVQHANLDGVHADVLDHRLDLRLQERGRHGMNALHADGVLRGQGGDRAHAVAAQRCKGLQIRLDAGATAAVRASDGEQSGVMGRRVRYGLGHDRLTVKGARDYPKNKKQGAV